MAASFTFCFGRKKPLKPSSLAFIAMVKHLVLVEGCHQVPHNNIFVNILCFDLPEATKIPMVKSNHTQNLLYVNGGAILIVIFFPGMACSCFFVLPLFDNYSL
jgi:hypothetical protein